MLISNHEARELPGRAAEEHLLVLLISNPLTHPVGTGAGPALSLAYFKRAALETPGRSSTLSLAYFKPVEGIPEVRVQYLPLSLAYFKQEPPAHDNAVLLLVLLISNQAPRGSRRREEDGHS